MRQVLQVRRIINLIDNVEDTWKRLRTFKQGLIFSSDYSEQLVNVDLAEILIIVQGLVQIYIPKDVLNVNGIWLFGTASLRLGQGSIIMRNTMPKWVIGEF